MESQQTAPLFRVRISDLEQAILANKRSKYKEDTDPLPSNQEANSISVRQWTVHSQRPVRPPPCKCPFHHKPQFAGQQRHFPGCRNHPSQKPKHTISDHRSQNHRKPERLSLTKLAFPRPTTQQSQTSIDIDFKKLKKSGMEKVKIQTQAQQQQHNFPQKQKFRFSKSRVDDIGKRISCIGREMNDQDMPDSDVNPRYMKNFDDFKYKYLQVVRYLTRHGYELEDSADVRKTTQFLDRIFRDMKGFEQQMIKRSYKYKKSPQMRGSQFLKLAKEQSRLQSKENSRSSKHSKKKLKSKVDLTEKSSFNKIQNVQSFSILKDEGSFHGVFKVKSFQYISLRDLLQDIEDEKIMQIAHADREELIEGLELIENELERELYKAKVTKTVSDFITESKTSHLIERVLKTVEGSTILNSSQISDRSELLQDGLRKIHKYESEIMNQATSQNMPSEPSESTATISDPAFKKLRKHRHGPSESRRQSETELGNVSAEEPESCLIVPQKGKKRISHIQMADNNQTVNIANKVFAKQKSDSFNLQKTALANIQQTEKLEKQAKVIVEQKESTDSEDDYQNELTSKIKASRRRRGINKLNMKESNEIIEDLLVQCESDREEELLDLSMQKRFGKRRASMRNGIDLQQLGKFKSPLVKMHKLKIKHIVKDINDLLINKNLVVFKITKQDSNIIRRRKLKKLKKFIQKEPEYYDRQLIRSINLYEQHQRLTKQAKVECMNFLENIQNKDDSIVLATINAALKKYTGLKWTDQLKSIEKKEQESDEISSDSGEIYLKQPVNRKSQIQGKFIQKVRYQIKQLKQTKTPVHQQDLLQRQLATRNTFQDIYVKHHRRKQSRNVLKTEPSFVRDPSDSKQKIRALIKTVHRVNRPLYRDLISQPIRFR